MKPTQNRLLVEVKEDKKDKAKFMTANVLAVGPDVKGIKVGDQVIFAPYGIDEVDDKKVIILEDLILAINDKK